MSEKISVFRIKFKNTNDLLVSEQHYRSFGSRLNFARHYGINFKDITRTYQELIDPRDYPQTAWSG